MIRPPADWLKRRGRQAERVMAREFAKGDKPKPMGRALPRTDADLDRLSEVTDADLDRALAEATPDMQELVTSEDDEGDG